jgi:DNA-binding response OmpR family regulator
MRHTGGVARITIVEDSEPIARLVADRLTDAGHLTEVIGDGLNAVDRFTTSRLPEAVVLDLMLPGCSGIEVCRQIRAAAGVQPVIVMLTARREESDAMEAYEAGADDYVRKPFGVAELVMRIEALLALADRQRPHLSESVVTEGPIRLDIAKRSVTVLDDELRLAPMEFDLLVRLCRSPGEVLDRDRLLKDVWGYTHGGYARTVDSHVTRLRRKLAKAGLEGAIVTVHGVGYRLELDPPGGS